MSKRIILASKSPRRKQLLKRLVGKIFIIHPSNYIEPVNSRLSPGQFVKKNSLEKSRDTAKHYNSGVVISADTVVVLNDTIIGKPSTAQKAKQILNKISGKFIRVFTGVTVLDISTKKCFCDCEVTRVKIKKLSSREINNYVLTKEPLDKAGAFAIQGKGKFLVEKIYGCYFNVVGLPLFKLTKMLKKVGINES